MTEKELKEKSFFRLVAGRIESFALKGKHKTEANYRCALRQFVAFRGGEDIAVGALTVSLLRDFQDFLVQRGLKMNTVSLYMRMLRAAYNYAVDEELVGEDKRPFRKVFTGRERTRKRALPQRVVKRLMTLRLTSPSLEFARDLFLFSIYMQGMPFVDIAHLKKTQLRCGYVVYQRQKTNRALRVRIDAHAWDIINKYRVNSASTPYLFPILADRAGERRHYDSALRLYNKRLEQISRMIRLDDSLTSYVARHTWASLARSCGISDTIISEAMGHNNVETTAIYLAALDVNTIATANRKLIASLMR